MPYPPAPWRLTGHAVQTLQLVGRSQARRFVPRDLQLLPILPGRALAGILLAAYGPGSALVYNELIVAVAVRYGGKWGFWIPQIYVDHVDSLAGGREIWGLPKELAQFAWEAGPPHRVSVRQGDRVLCVLDHGRPLRLWRGRVPFPSFCMLDDRVCPFRGDMAARLGVATGRLHVPADSPLAGLGLGAARLAYHFEAMTFTVGGPVVAG